MININEAAKKWMVDNNIELTTDRIITLSNLLTKIENDSYNDGLRCNIR